MDLIFPFLSEDIRIPLRPSTVVISLQETTDPSKALTPIPLFLLDLKQAQVPEGPRG